MQIVVHQSVVRHGAGEQRMNSLIQRTLSLLKEHAGRGGETHRFTAFKVPEHPDCASEQSWRRGKVAQSTEHRAVSNEQQARIKGVMRPLQCNVQSAMSRKQKSKQLCGLCSAP